MKIIEFFARVLAGWGVSANGMTVFGFLVNAGAGILAGRGMWGAAAGVAIFGGVCDLLDGKIARLHPSRSKFGALLDSSLDRYGDFFLIAGIGFYFSQQGSWAALLAAFSAIMGSFEVSYVRARAEGLGFECRVGFWERGERWVLLVAGLILAHPGTAILILAVATHVTAFRRIWHIHTTSQGRIHPAVSGAREAAKWSRPLNWIHAGLALGSTVLIRWPF